MTVKAKTITTLSKLKEFILSSLKFLVVILGTVTATTWSAIASGTMTPQSWGILIGGLVTAALTYGVSNKPTETPIDDSVEG